MRNALVRTIVSCTAFASILGCGSGPEIQQMRPSTIGARSPDFTLYVHGTGFTPQSRVVLGDVELDLVNPSPTFFAAQVPGGTAGTTAPGNLSVSVKNPDGSRSNQLLLTVAEAPAPVVSEVILLNACYSGDIELSGANFTTDTTVEVDGHVAAFAIRSSTSIWIRSPVPSTPFKVIVPAPGGGEASGFTPSIDPMGCD